MYKDLTAQLRLFETVCRHSEKPDIADLVRCAWQAIEKLNRYAAQMDKLREDGWYLLQETAGTYGQIAMKMPIPEPLSCDDVLAIINGELPKEE